MVNISLLAKWRWKLLNDDHAIWKDVLKSKYGNAVVGKVELGDDHKPWFASLWWRDICSIGSNLNHNWFAEAVSKILGNGLKTRFWNDIWAGEVPLQTRFPRLFSISNQKNSLVAEVVNLDVDGGRWNLLWRRRLFEWEKDLENDLLVLINPIWPLSNDVDRWGWKPENGADVTVSSTYRIVSNFSSLAFSVSPLNSRIFSSIWKCPAPSKVSGFVWQLLHGRIPTRNNLVVRGILVANGDVACGLCGEALETELHLFLYCEIATLVWMEIFSWLDVPFYLPHNLFSILHFFMEVGSKKGRKGMIMITAAVLWSLWRCRNAVLFDNGTGTVSELVEAVKVLSWKWWMSRTNPAPCMFYEWRAEPRLCMLR
jgi:hypothetical protein